MNVDRDGSNTMAQEAIQELLKQIVENTSKKSKTQIVLSGRGSKLNCKFEPVITPKRGCKFEVAFASLETYFSFPNIDLTNNTIRVTTKNGTLKTFTISTGCYSVIAINKDLSIQFLEDEEMSDSPVTFIPNYSTFKCRMLLEKNTKVDFSSRNSLASVLGFDRKIYRTGSKKKYFASEHIVDIMKVNSILIHCDLVGSSYLNAYRKPIIYSFFPNAVPGEKIVERPNGYIYLPVNQEVIHSVDVWLTDQSLNPIDLREETLTVKLFLREC